MAAATQDTGSGVLAQAADSAKQYVRDRLDESDVPLSPAELADEYGCSSGHMRDVCSKLHRAGVIDRPEDVDVGEYTITDDSADGSGDDGSDGQAFDLPAMAADTEESDPMVTQAEYERQHSQTDGEEADDSADGSDDEARTGADVVGSVGTSDGDADAPAPALPMDPQKLAKILAAALVLWLLYRRLGGGADDADAAEDDGDDLDGGLVG